MVSRSRITTVLRYGAVGIALILTAYNGLVEGLNAAHSAGTTGMKVATATQLLYGVAAVAVGTAAFLRPRLVFPILVVWAIGVVLTGTLAPVVYGGRSFRAGLLVGAGTAVIVALVLWAWPQRKRGANAAADPATT